MKDYEAWKAEYAVKEKRAKKLAGVPDKLADLEAKYEAARIYEDRLAEYEKAKAVYETKMAEVGSGRSRRKDTGRARRH